MAFFFASGLAEVLNGRGRAHAQPADVWQAIREVVPTPRYLFGDPSDAEPRRALVWGQPIFYRVDRVDGRPRQVLRFFAERYSGSWDWLLRYLPEQSAGSLAAMREQFRSIEQTSLLADDTFGVHVALEPTHPDAMREEVAARFERFRDRGPLSELWTARVTMVWAGAERDPSVAVSMWTAPEFDPRAFETGLRGEPQLPSPVEAHELVAVELIDEPRAPRLRLYHVSRSAGDVAATYRARAETEGWLVETGADHFAEGERSVLDLRRGELTSQITICPGDDGGAYVGTIVWNQQRQS